MNAALAFGLLVLGASGASAFPQFITYQGRYLSGGVPGTGSVSMEFRVTNGNTVACGSSLPTTNLSWTSGVQTIALSSGVFSYRMGLKADQATQDPAFVSINWGLANTTYYIDVCAGGVSLTPHDMIGSTVYSLSSNSAGSAAALSVAAAGKVVIADGTQAAGNVLTSDANGVAAWKAPSGGGASAAGFSTFRSFWSGPGTFSGVIPSTASKVLIEMWGGGGGGGGVGGNGTDSSGNPNSSGGLGGGGMGGQYLKVFLSAANGTLTPGTTIAVTVGAGGASSTNGANGSGPSSSGSSGTSGGNGGTTSIQTNNLIFTAYGGFGGGGGAGGSSNGNNGSSGNGGGNGTGFPSGPCTPTSSCNADVVLAADGQAGTPGGIGSNGGNGGTGGNPGGGGGGGANNPGGWGAVVIWY
ncbi:MAG: hypothetical protein ACHQ49_12760 [Elusimicrobiota bacterium]